MLHVCLSQGLHKFLRGSMGVGLVPDPRCLSPHDCAFVMKDSSGSSSSIGFDVSNASSSSSSSSNSSSSSDVLQATGYAQDEGGVLVRLLVQHEDFMGGRNAVPKQHQGNKGGQRTSQGDQHVSRGGQRTGQGDQRTSEGDQHMCEGDHDMSEGGRGPRTSTDATLLSVPHVGVVYLHLHTRGHDYPFTTLLQHGSSAQVGLAFCIVRVGQNHIYVRCIHGFWQ